MKYASFFHYVIYLKKPIMGNYSVPCATDFFPQLLMPTEANFPAHVYEILLCQEQEVVLENITWTRNKSQNKCKIAVSH